MNGEKIFGVFAWKGCLHFFASLAMLHISIMYLTRLSKQNMQTRTSHKLKWRNPNIMWIYQNLGTLYFNSKPNLGPLLEFPLLALPDRYVTAQLARPKTAGWGGQGSGHDGIGLYPNMPRRFHIHGFAFWNLLCWPVSRSFTVDSMVFFFRPLVKWWWLMFDTCEPGFFFGWPPKWLAYVI